MFLSDRRLSLLLSPLFPFPFLRCPVPSFCPPCFSPVILITVRVLKRGNTGLGAQEGLGAVKRGNPIDCLVLEEGSFLGRRSKWAGGGGGARDYFLY